MTSRIFIYLAALFVAAFLFEAADIVVAPDAAVAAPSDPCKGKPADRPAECDGGGGGGGGGSSIQSCAEVFGLTSGNCTCSFDVQIKDTTDSTPPEFTYVLEDDCTTDTMLAVPVFGSFLGGGFTLTAVDGAGGFSGPAVVTNVGYRAVIQGLTVNIASDAANACAGSLQAGILYSISDSTPPIDPLHPAIRLQARANTIKSEAGFGSVCRGIEATRTAAPAAFLDRIVNVSSNVLASASYADTGILVRGFGPSDSTGSEIRVTRNTVLAGSGGSSTAIQIGPASTDTVSLDNNLASAAPGGAGLAIFGEAVVPAGGVPLQVDVLRNTITGGMFGIVADGNVAATNIGGNSLDGDPANDGLGDIAVCDDSVAPRDRRNKSSGYDVELGGLGCSASAVPAS